VLDGEAAAVICDVELLDCRLGALFDYVIVIVCRFVMMPVDYEVNGETEGNCVVDDYGD
jgi:hypothetical protein